MTVMQEMAYNSIKKLPDSQIAILLDLINDELSFQDEGSSNQENISKRIGIVEGEVFYANDYDPIYEGNDEIEKMFGVA